MDLQICFLLLWPHQARSMVGEALEVPDPKDAPYFYDLDIEFRELGQVEHLEIAGQTVSVRRQLLDLKVSVAECRYELSGGFLDSAQQKHQQIQAGIAAWLAEHTGFSDDALTEIYTLVLLADVNQEAKTFLMENAVPAVRFLRDLSQPLEQADAEKVLSARARYSSVDHTIVDWSGAIVIAPDGEFESDLQLLKIGKYQILRYRMMDQDVQDMLRQVQQHLSRRPIWLASSNRILRKIVERRLELLLDFERIDQSLLLFGDWYSSEVYSLIVDRFDLDDWQALVKNKLDSLESIDSVIRESLSFSWRRAIDLIMFVGWIVLLVGYFYLFIVDL